MQNKKESILINLHDIQCNIPFIDCKSAPKFDVWMITSLSPHQRRKESLISFSKYLSVGSNLQATQP